MTYTISVSASMVHYNYCNSNFYNFCVHIHCHIYCSYAHSWLHPLPFVLTIMMQDVPLHPHGIPLQEFNEQMMMDKGTCWAYISDSLASFCWCVEHKPGWLTAYAQNKG